jgi:hypothetical protein
VAAGTQRVPEQVRRQQRIAPLVGDEDLHRTRGPPVAAYFLAGVFLAGAARIASAMPISTPLTIAV